MDRGATEYSQSGLHSPYPRAITDTQSEGSSADHASAAQYTPNQEARASSNSYSAAATPTSDYGLHPQSARSANFPEYIRPYQNTPSSSGGGMAQSQNPSIAASSPAYPQHNGQYSPYPPQQEMSHPYPQHPPGAMYPQARPDWAGYGQQAHHAPAGVRPGQHPMHQVYSFVPIPGAQQHKRPRRRYEEIERMYKCGWQGCEKAYGTLNHLNAHVTMQSHGSKRTPEEFKEIRKEWKARKKEEEAARKAEEERQRAAAAQAAPPDAQGPSDPSQPPAGYQASRPQVQLPPIGYSPGSQVPGQYQAPAGGVQQLQDYSSNHMYSGYPASPYGQSNQMYSQNNGPQPKYEH